MTLADQEYFALPAHKAAQSLDCLITFWHGDRYPDGTGGYEPQAALVAMALAFQERLREFRGCKREITRSPAAVEVLARGERLLCRQEDMPKEADHDAC